jgi:hypothetical protein
MDKTLFNLEAYVLKYASEYKPSMRVVYPPSNRITESYLSIIETILIDHIIRDPIYWKTYGIRMEMRDEVISCIEKIIKESNHIGSGFFGSVYKTKPPTCVRNIPSKTRFIAVKIEKFKYSVNDLGSFLHSAPHISQVVNINKIVGKLNIGPRFYDCFIMLGKTGDINIIKAYEYIDGITWDNIVWKSIIKKEEALAKLYKKIKKLNSAGIIHHDLNPTNVMVTNSNDVYIIDYDMAKLAKNDELNNMRMFNYSYSKGVASANLVFYVYNKLVSDKIIV